MKRRHFLQSSSLAIPFILPSKVWANPPSKRLAHATIGVGGMQGGNDLAAIVASGLVDMVGLCDVDQNHLDAAGKAHPSARKFRDFREMLSALGDTVDSVNIAVPDHMHGIIALTALKMGKHVYCQKPLAHTVAEARAMRDAARKAGVVTQMGNQIQSDSAYRTAVQMVRDGVIGKVHEVRAWCSSSFPQTGRPATPDEVPPTLDWDKWLGVANFRPFKKDVYHTVQWRGWQEFGGGAIGDFCCHILDTPFKALGLTAPLNMVAEVPEDWAANAGQNREVWPLWEKVTYEFPGTEFTTGPTIKVTWSDNASLPSSEGLPSEVDRKLPPGGSLLLGEKGTILVPHVARPQLLPREADKAFRQKLVPGSPQDHYTTFVKACLKLEDAKTASHFDYAAPLAETGLLGLVAMRFPGKKLAWDAAKMSFPDHPDANQFLHVKYRDGWSV